MRLIIGFKNFFMKRVLFAICIFLPMLAWSCTSGRTATETDVTAALAECGRYEGAEVIKLGRAATVALKGVVRIAGIDDPDVREALGLIKNIRGISVLSYDDCSAEDKSSICSKLERALDGSELLIEAKDSDDKVKLYGRMDDDSDVVRDIVVYVPSSCAMVCIAGNVSMETLAKLAADD